MTGAYSPGAAVSVLVAESRPRRTGVAAGASDTEISAAGGATGAAAGASSRRGGAECDPADATSGRASARASDTGGGSYALKSSESSPFACAPPVGFVGLAVFAGEGLGFATGALPGAGFPSAFFDRPLFQPNIEKATKKLPGLRRIGAKAKWRSLYH